MKKVISPLILLLVVSMLLFTQAEATKTTKSASFPNKSGTLLPSFPSWYAWSATGLAAATDSIQTAVFHLNQPTNPEDSTIAVLNVYTQSGNGDSVDISVRFQQSSDGTNFHSYTVGTDSTSWVSTLTTANGTYQLTSVIINATSFGGFQPYQRILIYGNTGNNDGTVTTTVTKVKFDLIVKPR